METSAPYTFEPVRAEDARPRLRWWSHAWRIALCLVISGANWSTYFLDEWRDVRWLFPTDLAIGLLAFVLVFYRRRWPVTIALVLALMTTLSAVAGGPATLAAVSLATLRRPMPILVVGVVSIGAERIFSSFFPDTGVSFWFGLVTAAIATALIMAVGMYIGSRRELLATLRQRALRAESEQALRVEQAQGQERGRIAREMHDVLAHRISQIAMQAGALGFRRDLDADALRGGIGEIQDNANAALAELRGVLGVLRDGSGTLAQRPQPTYDDIADLVGDAMAAGMPIDFDDSVDGAPAHSVGRALYRLIQEGITNSRKHAPGARLRISLSGNEEDGVEAVLVNPLGFTDRQHTLPRSGVGLIGMAERVELLGGRLERHEDRRAFTLRAWLPWDA